MDDPRAAFFTSQQPPTTALTSSQQPARVQAMASSSLVVSDPSRLTRGGEPVYKSAFVNVLYERFLFPDRAFESASHHTPNICSGWMASACTLGEGNTLLSEVLLALSTVLVGADLQDPTITGHSRTRYHKAINGVRRAVEEKIVTSSHGIASESMLMTCMACAKYEASTDCRLR